MKSNLEQVVFNILPEISVSFQTRAEHLMIAQYELFQEALDKLIEKYDPNDTEKLKRWVPVPREKSREGLRNLWLTKDQRETVKYFADKASITLGQNIKPGAVIRYVMAGATGRADLYS